MQSGQQSALISCHSITAPWKYCVCLHAKQLSSMNSMSTCVAVWLQLYNMLFVMTNKLQFGIHNLIMFCFWMWMQIGCVPYSLNMFCVHASHGMSFLVLSWSRTQIWGGGQGKSWGNGCWELLLYLTPHSAFVDFSPRFGAKTSERTERAQREDSSNREKYRRRRLKGADWSWRVRTSS